MVKECVCLYHDTSDEETRKAYGCHITHLPYIKRERMVKSREAENSKTWFCTIDVSPLAAFCGAL